MCHMILFVCYRDIHRNISNLNLEDLNVLKTVKEITGYMVIQADHSLDMFTNLAFLSNLEVIHGRETS